MKLLSSAHDRGAPRKPVLEQDYEEPEEDDDDDGRARKKKKPWRYKWPQEFHDEVLARLLELNQQYAEAERLAGESAAASDPKPKKKAGKKKTGKKKAGKKKTGKKKAGKKKAGKKKTSERGPTQVSLLGDDD